MKKSEVLEQIARIFGNRGSGDYNSGEEAAPYVLEYLESIGMLPPVRYISNVKELNKNEWEPENE